MRKSKRLILKGGIRKYISFSGIFVVLFAACKEHYSQNVFQLIDIGSQIENTQKIYLSEFSHQIKYIPLEVDNNNLVSDLDLFDFSDKYILGSNFKHCFLFDLQGRLIKQIGTNGRGPGEYLSISHLYMRNGNIYVRNFFGDAILEYNRNGSYLRTYESGLTAENKYRMENFIMLNDTLLFGNIENKFGNEEYKALIIDLKGRIVKSYKNHIYFTLASDQDHFNSPGEASIIKFDEKFFIKEFYNDTLFVLDEKYNLIPSLIFDLGAYKEPLSKIGIFWKETNLPYIYINKIFMTNKYVFLECDFNNHYPVRRITPRIIKIPGVNDYTQWYNFTGQSMLGIYCKKTQKLVFVEPSSTDIQLLSSGLYNDIDAGPRFFPQKMINDSTMLMKIRFDYLVEQIESEDFKSDVPKFPERKKRLEAFVDSLKVIGFDNPILMCVTFNK